VRQEEKIFSPLKVLPKIWAGSEEMLAKGRIKLWSIGSGKGGVGKSFFTLTLGVSLARLGKKVILIDGDLGGANLHTLMGMRYPQVTLEDFLYKRVSHLEDVILKTQVEGVGIICGANDLLGAANPTYSQKLRLIQQIEALPADFIFLDLGAGTSFNILDLFNSSPGKITVFTNQVTSLQNVYGFIKSALFRKISREFAKDDEIFSLLHEMGSKDSEENIQSLQDLSSYLKASMPEKETRLAWVLQNFQIFLLVNMVRTELDAQAAAIIGAVCHDFLGIRTELLGHLVQDPAIELAINQMRPLELHQQKSPAARQISQIAQDFLLCNRLVGSWHSPGTPSLAVS
jgi:flagellar biosynthesis protein FlhG